MRLATLAAMIAGAVDSSSATCNIDTAGYDEDEMHAVVGAAVHRYMANRAGGGGMMARRPGMAGRGTNIGPARAGNGTYAYPPLPAVGMHPPSKLRSFVGLGVISWTGATDKADKTTSITPQAPIRGERLVIDVVATSGAAGLVTVNLLQVGVEPQQADTSQPAPASMFAKDVTYGHIAMQVADPGIRVALTLGITDNPGSGETVTAAAGLFVEWVRGQA
jgi:hypothetical protein